MCLGANILLIEAMQNRMASTICCRTGARRLCTTEVLALTAKRTLVDLAIVQSRERHTVVLEFIDGRDGLAAHELDGVLIAEVVGTLDGIEHVPVPVVRQNVCQCRVHSTLRSHRV